MASYASRFTANGHSISTLRRRASALKAEAGYTHNQALNAIARAVGYSDWPTLIAEEPDEIRDAFFSQAMRDGRSRPDYRAFLIQRGFDDSPDAFRQFLVEDYRTFRALGFDRYQLSRAPGDPEELCQQLARLGETGGAEALLPQNLADELLERLVGHTRLAYAYMQHTSGLQLPPTDHLGPILQCVIKITHHLRTQRHPHAQRYKIKWEELEDSVQNYRIRVELEFLSRKTQVKFERTTLANVLVGAEHVVVQVEPNRS